MAGLPMESVTSEPLASCPAGSVGTVYPSAV
jgi:hypothetical protein